MDRQGADAAAAPYRGARITEPPAPELVAAGFAPESEHGRALHVDLSLADLAHAVALGEGGALSGERLAGLLGGLLSLHDVPVGEFPYDPALGDAFNSREAELVRRVGPDAAGWLNAGRPRREAWRVALRLGARRRVLGLVDQQTHLVEALHAQAVAYRDAVCADYTYLQPAQPTTFGHLLLAVAYPVLRDAGRLKKVHGWLDASVAGAGGSAGSRWPLDRARLAELLGCGSVMPHTRDAMWQADGYVELLAAVATHTTHLAQLAADLEVYCSREFGLVELAGRHSRASALMPQKRNPYALAVLRAAAGRSAGDLAGLLTTLHTGSARTDHFVWLNGGVPAALDHATAVTRLAAEVVAGLTADRARLAAAAVDGFVAAADVADVLSLDAGLDYRAAHAVVGRAVRALADAGEAPGDLDVARLVAAARDVVDDDFAEKVAALDPAVLAAALDPAVDARTRPQAGSSSPDAMRAMLDDVERSAGGLRSWHAAASQTAASAEDALVALAARRAAEQEAPEPPS